MTKLRGWAMICKLALILSARATLNTNLKLQPLQTPASNLWICKSALRRMKPSEAACPFDLLMCFSQVKQSSRDCISCCCWWLPAGWLLADTADWYNMILQQQRRSKSVWNAAVSPPGQSESINNAERLRGLSLPLKAAGLSDQIHFHSQTQLMDGILWRWHWCTESS